jgi:hypothetical protein
MKVQEIQVGLKINGTHQLLVCVDDVNLLADDIHTLKKNTGISIDVSMEVDLEVNAEKIKYLTRMQDKIITIKIVSRSFENMSRLK